MDPQKLRLLNRMEKGKPDSIPADKIAVGLDQAAKPQLDKMVSDLRLTGDVDAILLLAAFALDILQSTEETGTMMFYGFLLSIGFPITRDVLLSPLV